MTGQEMLKVAADEKNYRVGEAAEIVAVSRSALYGYMDRGMLAYLKLGGARRIPGWAINKFLQDSLVQGTK